MIDAQTLAEMNNLRIRIDERDNRIANQANVITKLEQSRKDMKEARQALLRVARAAKEDKRVHKVVDGTTTGTIWEMKRASAELEEALKEVEHLL